MADQNWLPYIMFHSWLNNYSTRSKNLQFLEKVFSFIHFDGFFRVSIVLWHYLSKFAKDSLQNENFKHFLL